MSVDKIKKLVTKIKAQNSRLLVLNELVEVESTTHDLYLLLKEILLLTIRATVVETGFIVLYNKHESTQFEIGAVNTTEQMSDKTLIKDICENVIRTQKPVIINDTRMHKRLRRCKIKNIIALPLIYGKEPIAVFIIINKLKNLFKKKDLMMFSMICKFTATAIEHAKGTRKLDEKNKELSTIYSIDRIRDTIKDFNTMMDAILQEITQTIDTKLAFFLMYNKKKNKTDLKVSGKLKTSTFVHNNSDAIYDISRAALNQGELVEFSDVNKDIYSAICTPIVISDDDVGVFGAINPVSKSAGFTRIDKKILTAIAKQSDSAVFEDIEKTQIKNVFGKYVSPEVITELLDDPEKNYLKTDRREMTVLFSDVRGFTAMSEKTDAEDVVKILNEHFEIMSTIILKNRGTLDKFVGDEIMALFGAPVYTESHALKAIKTALEMQNAQKELSRKIKRRFGVVVDIGIGINTGDMVVGNIGCKQRMDYTVIGDSVNTAARLCGSAGPGQIMISEATYNEVKKFVDVETLEPIKVKGKSKPLQVYNVVKLKK